MVFVFKFQGPWSTEFISKTFPISKNGISSSMLWSTQEGFLKSDMTGENMETLLRNTDLQNTYITDISWFRDQLFLVTNQSNVLCYNISSGQSDWIPNLDNVGSLAVDWIGKKLYWSSPKQQLVSIIILLKTNYVVRTL